MKYRTIRAGVFTAVLTLLCAAAVQAAPFEPSSPDQKKPDAVEQATAHLRAGQPEAAIALLKKALAVTPNSARLRYYLGLAHAANNEVDLAKAQFEAVLREDADYVDAHVRIAEVLVRKMSMTNTKAQNLNICLAAVKELTRALEKSPKRADLYYKLVSEHLRCTTFREAGADADFAKAIKLLEAVRSLEPKRVKPYLLAGNIYIGQVSRLAGGESISDLDDNAKKKAKSLFAKAQASFRQALDLDPGSLVALIRIAAIRAQQDDVKAAVKVLGDHLAKLESPAKKAVCYRQMGLYLIRSNALKEAEANLNKAIKANPKELASYLLLARIYSTNNAPEAAAKMLRSATEAAPMFLNAHIQLGQLALSRRNLPEAELHFTRALNIPRSKAVAVSLSDMPPQDALRDLYVQAAVRLGNVLVVNSRLDDAIAVFRKLRGLAPGSPVPDFQIGQIYRRKGMLNKARGHYENALRMNRNFVSALIANAEVTVAEARIARTNEVRSQILARAIGQYDLALRLQPKNAKMLARIASLHVRLAGVIEPKNRRRELERALAGIKAARKIDPKSNQFRLQFAKIQNELGHKAEAVAELNKIIDDVEKTVKNEPDSIAAIFNLADMRVLLHSWEPNKKILAKAIEGFGLVVEKRPDMVAAYIRAARALEADKNYKDAAVWLKKLLVAMMGGKEPYELSGPRASHALQASANLAWTYVEYLNDLDQAAKYAEIALKFDPNLPALLDTQGWIHYKAGHYGQAVAPLRRALSANPDNPVIGYHLGAVLAKLNNAPRAREALTHALKHAGSDKKLRTKIEKLLKAVGK